MDHRRLGGIVPGRHRCHLRPQCWDALGQAGISHRGAGADGYACRRLPGDRRRHRASPCRGGAGAAARRALAGQSHLQGSLGTRGVRRRTREPWPEGTLSWRFARPGVLAPLTQATMQRQRDHRPGQTRPHAAPCRVQPEVGHPERRRHRGRRRRRCHPRAAPMRSRRRRPDARKRAHYDRTAKPSRAAPGRPVGSRIPRRPPVRMHRDRPTVGTPAPAPAPGQPHRPPAGPRTPRSVQGAVKRMGTTTSTQGGEPTARHRSLSTIRTLGAHSASGQGDCHRVDHCTAGVAALRRCPFGQRGPDRGSGVRCRRPG